MRKRSSGRSSVAAAASSGFLAGAIAMAVVFWGLTRSPNTTGQYAAQGLVADDRANVPTVSDNGGEAVPETSPSSLSSSTTPPTIEADPIAELRDRHLDLPVRGLEKRDLRDSFSETRGSTHYHEAIDIIAPRNTPVLAVDGGTIAKLFDSKAGGITVYEFDPTARYVYYYAHLERYADGLKDGDPVQRGQVLGYVGTSGNAPKDTPHLHFAILRLTEKKRWWEGTPINPYEVLK
jgi:peptidoglycan LD-endopeptidase LytH